ncbi:MAG: MHS family MFS transporter [Actinomycetota bacterium]|nr:MHS family MFS transporter [Actinomycetota bacterium]
MENVGGEEQGRTASIRQVAAASLLGTTIEWYDFFIYVTAASFVFNQLFFPSYAPLVGTLLALSTNAVGFVARPIGGAVFGHFGDKIGRKSMLIATLLLMGLATFAIGLLPTENQIGIAAPNLLGALRFLQGLGLGGEWGGAVLMAVEHAPEGRRGFYGSFPQMGIPAGVILSSIVFLFVTSLPEEQFLAWGWRVPFLLSILLVAVGLFIRLRILESPAFQRLREAGGAVAVPIVEVFRNNLKQLFVVAGAYLAQNVTFYILISFTLTYGEETLKLPRNLMISIIIISSIASFLMMPLFAALSDRVGRKLMLLTGAAGMGTLCFVMFPLLDTKNYALMLGGHLLLTVFQSMNLGPIAAFFVEQFDTRVRYTGATMGYQLGTVAAGGLAPIIATAILQQTGSSIFIALYMAVVALISFIAISAGRETYQRDLDADSSSESAPAPG